MKRRVLAAILVLCLLVGFPVMVYGGDEDNPGEPTITNSAPSTDPPE